MDRSKLPRNRKAAIDFYTRVLTAAAEKGENHLWMAKRWLARNDLFFLLAFICKRKDLNRDWLFDRCREVEHAPNGFLDLWAREHYKSTLITFGLSLQDILASHGEDPEPRYNGREVTIGIFSLTTPLAKDFLNQIKREVETNVDLITLFPDVLWEHPRRQAQKWSEDDGLIFKRVSNPREATIEASGLVDGQPTGKHFWTLVYDDIVTEESVTETLIKKTTKAWELSTNLGAEGGNERYVGTRYALHDTYSVMMKRGIPTRTYPCTSDGSEDFSKSVLVGSSHLAAKRKKQGPYTFAAQMLLDPLGDKSQGFREEWLRYWPNRNHDGLNIYILVDPANEKKKDNDWTAMWVIGVGGDRNYYAIDVVHDRMNLTERTNMLFELHRKYRPKAVGYERYGKDSDIGHIEYVMGEENYRFTITEVGGPMPKNDRIRRLVPLFETGRIFLPETGIVRIDYEGNATDVIRKFVDEQYTAFPMVKFDDLLDALARLPDIDITFPDPSDFEEEPKWMQDLADDYSDDDDLTTPFMTA